MLFQKTELKFIFTLLISVSIAIGGSGVRGMVTNSYGFPLAGVLVCALEAEKGESCWTTYWQSRRMTTTDSEGLYSIDLPTGYHSMYITLDSIVSRSGCVVLVNNAYLDLNFSEEIVPNEPGSISGLVTDQNGTPLEEAFVLAQTTGARVRTDSCGRYIIADLPPGFHTLEAGLYGMLSVTNDSIWAFPEGESECNFDTASGRALQDTTGYISGIVETTYGSPAISFTVSVVGTSLGSMTDSTGAYSIRFFEPGNFTLRASCVGYLPSFSPIIKVIAGEVFEYNFIPSTFLEADSTGGALRPGPHSGTNIVITDSR
ncbi:MAG: carboxypeptidase regulatory-like domain-containing protein [Candidatus Fermentibacteraceae bacterium]|nr:carboxypeptidase regulatory-like domain-containing protein [Candidatus Fermentibacteraceae bacterium]RKZ02418.1 MAG: hypothetical protein DRQ21_08825 [Candidatus Fermentibacteria bacterium]